MLIDFFFCTTITSVIIGIYFYLSYNVGFNLADEGYLWYGTIRVLNKEVPIRDFRAYDPGRYYWCALFAFFFNKSLLTIRFANITVAWLALSITSFIIFTVTSSWALTLLFPIISIFWMTPIYKIIDTATPLFTIIFLFLMVSQPSPITISVAAFWIAFSLFIGANHFLYNGLAFLGAMLFFLIKINFLTVFDVLLFTLIGGLTGLIPTIVFLMIPGTYSAYYRKKIKKVFSRGTTNLKIPIPFFWKPIPKGLQSKIKTTQLLLGLQSIILPVFYIFGIIYTVLFASTESDYLLFTASLVGLTYLNHYYSRADKDHITSITIPFIIGIIAINNPILLSLSIVYLLYMSYGIVGSAFYDMLSISKYGQNSRKLNRTNASVWLDEPYGNHIEQLVKKIESNSTKRCNIFLAPMWVGLFPLLDRKSEVYDTFPVYPATKMEQQTMINQIKDGNIGFAAIENVNLDGQEYLRFENTYSLVWAYLSENFELLDSTPFGHNMNFFRKRNTANTEVNK